MDSQVNFLLSINFVRFLILTIIRLFKKSEIKFLKLMKLFFYFY